MNYNIRGDLSILENRIKTYHNWPSSLADRDRFAESGFFYTNSTLECFACGTSLLNCKEGEDVEQTHLLSSPNCPYVNRPKENQQSREGFPHYADYSTHSWRLKTFNNWPHDSQRKNISLTGLFHLGEGDKAMCYWCGGIVYHWNTNDDPWKEHARWFPECYYILLMKGKEFAEGVKNETTFETVSLDRNICKICFSKNMSCLLFPCGHVATCTLCAQSVKNCPICQKEANSTRRIYYS